MLPESRPSDRRGRSWRRTATQGQSVARSGITPSGIAVGVRRGVPAYQVHLVLALVGGEQEVGIHRQTAVRIGIELDAAEVVFQDGALSRPLGVEPGP